jgi:VWFA-related protein
LVFPIYYSTLATNQDSAILLPAVPGGNDNMDSRGSSKEEYAVGRKYLEDLAASTGGRVFSAEASPDGLKTAFEGIAEELHNQYNIGYYPQNEGVAGQRKQVRVRVNRPNLVVQARDSYIVGVNNLH